MRAKNGATKIAGAKVAVTGMEVKATGAKIAGIKPH